MELADSHVKFIKVWLKSGPEVARKWAELTGLHQAAPSLFADPAEQAALEQAVKACGKPSSKPGASAAAGSGQQQRKRPRLPGGKQGGSAQARAALVCYTCGGTGHWASECPSEVDGIKQLRPPQ